jgi:hypothetical protein
VVGGAALLLYGLDSTMYDQNQMSNKLGVNRISDIYDFGVSWLFAFRTS